MKELLQPLFTFLKSYKEILPEEIDLISESITTRKVDEGTVLLKEGKLAKELYFICSGILKITTINTKGNEVTQFFLKQNVFCTILNSFNNNVPSNESIIAACDAELIVFTKESLLNLYKKIPYFKPLIDGITQQALLNKIALRNGYLGEEAAVRYQRFLQQQPDIALKVSLTDIASYLGITPQSLSRIRRGKK